MTFPRLALAVPCALLFAACPKTITEKDELASSAHYQLALDAQKTGNIPMAMRELQTAIEINPKNSDAHHLRGVLLHISFKHYEEAEQEFRLAMKLDPNLTIAVVNLGNLYLDRGRYAEAIAMYDQALNDLRYETPYLAQTNRGWAQFKMGKVDQAIEDLKSATTTNPKFCLAHRNLAQIYEEQGKTELACHSYKDFTEACTDLAEGFFKLGVCEAKQAHSEEAKKAFSECAVKAQGQLRDDCRRLLDSLQ